MLTNIPEKPDVALIHLGTNDLQLRCRNENQAWYALNTDEIKDNLREIIRKLRAEKNANIRVFLAQIIPTIPAWNTECTNDLKDPGWIPDPNAELNKDLNPAIRLLNEKIAVLVDEENRADSPVCLVDQFSGMIDGARNVQWMYYRPDGLHPNDDGAIEIARRWFLALTGKEPTGRGECLP